MTTSCNVCGRVGEPCVDPQRITEAMIYDGRCHDCGNAYHQRASKVARQLVHAAVRHNMRQIDTDTYVRLTYPLWESLTDRDEAVAVGRYLHMTAATAVGWMGTQVGVDPLQIVDDASFLGMDQ